MRRIGTIPIEIVSSSRASLHGSIGCRPCNKSAEDWPDAARTARAHTQTCIHSLALSKSLLPADSRQTAHRESHCKPLRRSASYRLPRFTFDGSFTSIGHHLQFNLRYARYRLSAQPIPLSVTSSYSINRTIDKRWPTFEIVFEFCVCRESTQLMSTI